MQQTTWHQKQKKKHNNNNNHFVGHVTCCDDCEDMRTIVYKQHVWVGVGEVKERKRDGERA